MKFHVEVSHRTNSNQAGAEVAEGIKNRFGASVADFAVLFFSATYAEEVKPMVEAIRSVLAPKVLIGCMGEGVIAQSQEYEDAPVVSLWAAELPQVQVVPFHMTFQEDDRHGHQVTGWPEDLRDTQSSPTFLVFADPFSTPIEEFFALVDRRCPGAQAIGGVASGGTDLGENRLILNGDVFFGGIVGVAISGDVSIRTVVSQGCRPIGDRYVVTKAERNIIYELAGVPTLERLQTILDGLGSEGGRKAAMALQIGVAFDELQPRFDRGDFLIRGLIGADQNTGGVAVSDIVKEGQTVQFHLRDAAAASEEFNLLLAKDRVTHPNASPQGALLFSCNGRGKRFFGQADHDIGVLRSRAGNIPIAGFFAAGEIGPVSGQNFLHGYTASVALFAEPGTQTG